MSVDPRSGRPRFFYATRDTIRIELGYLRMYNHGTVCYGKRVTSHVISRQFGGSDGRYMGAVFNFHLTGVSGPISLRTGTRVTYKHCTIQLAVLYRCFGN